MVLYQLTEDPEQTKKAKKDLWNPVINISILFVLLGYILYFASYLIPRSGLMSGYLNDLAWMISIIKTTNGTVTSVFIDGMNTPATVNADGSFDVTTASGNINVKFADEPYSGGTVTANGQNFAFAAGSSLSVVGNSLVISAEKNAFQASDQVITPDGSGFEYDYERQPNLIDWNELHGMNSANSVQLADASDASPWEYVGATQIGIGASGATTNTPSVTTTIDTSTPASQTQASDADSLGVSANNGLGGSGSYSFGIDPSTTPTGTGWDVNTAQGNYALAGYIATQDLRSGNSSLGLKVTLPPAVTQDFANPDYSLSGAALNTTASGLSFTVPVDPLILDLDGGGVALTSYADAPVQFDIDNDGSTQFNGSKEQSGWMAAGEGMVVQDLNGNGQIDGIAETLSEYYNGTSGGQSGQVGQAGQKRYASGFAALKSLDSNNDNQFTSADAAWGSLRVWTNSNHDGKTDAGELKTFAQLGITSINLSATAQSGLVNLLIGGGAASNTARRLTA